MSVHTVIHEDLPLYNTTIPKALVKSLDHDTVIKSKCDQSLALGEPFYKRPQFFLKKNILNFNK